MFRGKIFSYFEIAGRIAKSKKDKRTFLLGAIGIRRDGAMVSAYNSAATSPTPAAHAEARLVKKLDHNATVYVARIALGTGEFAMAKPCHNCERALRSRGVKRVYYTIGPKEYGIMDL